MALWGMAKSILEAAPLEYWMRGESLMNTRSALFDAAFRPDLDVEFLVGEADAEWARDLLADLTPASGASQE